MENEDIEVIYEGYYDEKNYKFMLSPTSKISFEDLYNNSKEKTIDNKHNELINEKNIPHIKYLYKNPHKINFTFPDGQTHEIYIANMMQFLFINVKINTDKKYKAVISDDGIKYYLKCDNNKIYASKYIKYTISSINYEDYKNSRSYIDDKKALSLKNLSINCEYYLEYTNFINNSQNFFLNTDERKEFFSFLDDKLLEHKYLAICGLEGIGKTASILAYLKYSTNSYYYFNIKTVDNLLANNEISKLRDILLKEMYHFIIFERAKHYYDFIDEILKEKISSIDIFKKIFAQINDEVEIIVLDQYKTKYDKDYYKLSSILNSEYNNKLIIMSSMNEDDIRESILNSLKWALNMSNEKPKLDYYYIINLVKVSKDDINLLNDEQKQLLKEFGNLYIYYYKIKEAISKPSHNLSISFKNEITNEMNCKIKEFYYNSDKKDLFQTFISLILDDEKEHKVLDCIKLIDKIPLRYFLIKHENKNIIHFSELKETDTISFNSAYIYVREYFLNYYKSAFINKENNDFNKNNEKNQDSIDLEKYFGYFLWAFRDVVKLNGTKIVSYETVNSIIDMKDCYIESLLSKIKKLQNGESILIMQNDQNARMFDIGILEKKDEKFNLYLIQVTTKKNSDERITLTGLNDNVNYLNGFFSLKLGIEFGNNYFCYIFNYNDLDNATIEYCKRNNIDYFLFDFQNLFLSGDLVLKTLKYYLPALKYSEELVNNNRMINIEKIKFSECKTELDNHLKETKKFLNRKRELMGNKNLKITELEELKAYESKIKGNTKVVPINYERKEFIINNYLLSTDFKNKKLYGISYKRRNKNKIKFSEKEKKNLFELCGKSTDNSEIFQIDILKLFNFNAVKPEFGCYIVFVQNNNKKYFFDFINKKYYDLDDMSNDSYIGKKLFGIGDFYSIIYLDNNIEI